MALEISGATLSFPLAPHDPDNPKTATLYVVLVDPNTGAILQKSLAITPNPGERDDLLARATTALQEAGLL